MILHQKIKSTNKEVYKSKFNEEINYLLSCKRFGILNISCKMYRFLYTNKSCGRLDVSWHNKILNKHLKKIITSGIFSSNQMI